MNPRIDSGGPVSELTCFEHIFSDLLGGLVGNQKHSNKPFEEMLAMANAQTLDAMKFIREHVYHTHLLKASELPLETQEFIKANPTAVKAPDPSGGNWERSGPQVDSWEKKG